MKGFTSHIFKFMQKARLLPESGKVVIALSGGRDSMALLHVVCVLKKQGLLKSVRAFHVNHGTRPENGEEEELVKKFCQKLGVSALVFHPSLNPKVSNFEHHAREKRYELFFSNLQPDEVLLTAHHIDDSFEWSLLRQLKSGSTQTLGIPVKNGRVLRPFNCVTRSQIARYVEKNNIPFLYDPSNDLTRFERNFIREEIIPSIAKRYPNYLKHYVHRSNEQAQKLGQSALTKNNAKFKLVKNENGILIAHPMGLSDFSGAQSSILKAISLLSSKGRGTLGSQVEKIIEAAANGKKGPLLFSGDVLGHITHGALYFTKKMNNLKHVDEVFLKTLKKHDFKMNSYQTVKEVLKYPERLTFPFLAFSPEMPKNFPSIKKEHPLFPKSTEYALKNGLWVNTLPRLLFYLERGPRNQLDQTFPILIS